MELNHVEKTETLESGGGMTLDILTLKDGRVLCIGDDAIVLYSDRADFDAATAADRPTIFRE